MIVVTEALTKKYAEAFDAKDAATLSSLLHDDVVLFDPNAGRVEGKAAVMSLNQGIFDALKSMSLTARNIFVDGAHTILEFELDADGKKIVGVDVMRWRGDRLEEIRAYVNA